MEEIKRWETVTIKLPPRVRALLEDQLERVRNLANIDPEGKLPDEVADGLAMELILADFAGGSDEWIYEKTHL